jgi:hypothetical protein
MDVQNLYAHSAQRISQGERVKGAGPATSRRCCRSSSSTTTPTAHTDRLISTRPPAALPRPPARSSVPYDATGSAALFTSTCTSHDMTGFSAPTPVGMRGHAQDVQEAVADLECEQDVESPERHRAVDVEEADREHAGGLRVQELPPTRIGPPHRRRRYPVLSADPADRRGADAVAELE